jgi:hypothetical protein
MSGRKTFVGGDILLASELNSFLMDQSVMVFADEAARNTAISLPVEGMVTFIADQDSVQIYDGVAWRYSLKTTGGILQVVSTTKTNDFSTASTSYVDIPDLDVSITPISASSNILVFGSFGMIGHLGSASVRIQCVRDSTPIGNSTTGTAAATGAFSQITSDWQGNSAAFTFLDAPNTTSATTYKFQMSTSTSTAFINVRGAITAHTGVSTITVMEVSA